MSAANNERRQVLNPRVILDGSILTNLKCLEIVLKIILYKLVQDTYLTHNFRWHTFNEVQTFMLIFLDELPSASQIKLDARALYGK
jgi:hypothetical protein